MGTEGTGWEIESAVEKVLEADPLTGVEVDRSRVSYRDGFRIESDDGRFALRINGRVDTRYTYRTRDPGEDDSSFRVRRARLAFRGHAIDPSIAYKIQVSLNSNSDDGQSALQDAWLEWRASDELAVRAGQFRAPFGRQVLVPSLRLEFQERSETMRYFSLSRQIGLQGSWEESDGYGQVLAGIFNGDGDDLQGSLNDNNEVLFVARAQVNPTGAWERREGDFDPSAAPLVSMGASFFYNPEGPRVVNGVRTELDTTGVGLDAAMRYAGSFLTGEVFQRRSDEDGSASFDSIDEDGFHVQAGYFLIPERLEAAARYSSYRVDGGPGEEDNDEIGVSLGYFLVGDNHKLRLEWIRSDTDPEDGPNQTDHRVRIQWTLSF